MSKTLLLRGQFALIVIALMAAVALSLTLAVQPAQAGTTEYCEWEYQWNPGCPYTQGCGPNYNWQSQSGYQRECCLLYGQWVCGSWQSTARCGCGG